MQGQQNESSLLPLKDIRKILAGIALTRPDGNVMMFSSVFLFAGIILIVAAPGVVCQGYRAHKVIEKS